MKLEVKTETKFQADIRNDEGKYMGSIISYDEKTFKILMAAEEMYDLLTVITPVNKCYVNDKYRLLDSIDSSKT